MTGIVFGLEMSPARTCHRLPALRLCQQTADLLRQRRRIALRRQKSRLLMADHFGDVAVERAHDHDAGRRHVDEAERRSSLAVAVGRRATRRKKQMMRVSLLNEARVREKTDELHAR